MYTYVYKRRNRRNLRDHAYGENLPQQHDTLSAQTDLRKHAHGSPPGAERIKPRARIVWKVHLWYHKKEREREREREKEGRKGERGRACVCMCMCVSVYVSVNQDWLMLLRLLHKKKSGSFAGSSICSSYSVCPNFHGTRRITIRHNIVLSSVNWLSSFLQRVAKHYRMPNRASIFHCYAENYRANMRKEICTASCESEPAFRQNTQKDTIFHPVSAMKNGTHLTLPLWTPLNSGNLLLVQFVVAQLRPRS